MNKIKGDTLLLTDGTREFLYQLGKEKNAFHIEIKKSEAKIGPEKLNCKKI